MGSQEESNASDSRWSRIAECRLPIPDCILHKTKRKPDYMLGESNYVITEPIESGGFGNVSRCRDCKSGKIVAIKEIPATRIKEGIPSSIIREVSLLKELDHSNIVRLLNVYPRLLFVCLVFENLDCDLHHFINRKDYNANPLTIKRFLHQILSAVAYCHANKILHRDLKPQNVLVDVSNSIVKLADFGLARSFGEPDTIYTDHVATLYYRAPEILFTNGQYSSPADVWSVGCIFGEMVIRHGVFESTKCPSELQAIFSVLGTPTEETWPGLTDLCVLKVNDFPQCEPMDLRQMFPGLEPVGIDLLSKMLFMDPTRRISAEHALEHPYFEDLKLEGSSTS